MVTKIQNGGQKSKWRQMVIFFIKKTSETTSIWQFINHFWMEFVKYRPNEQFEPSKHYRGIPRWRQRSKNVFLLPNGQFSTDFLKLHFCVLFHSLASIKHRCVGSFRIQNGGANRINCFLGKNRLKKPSISLPTQQQNATV
jgi:hypothetical protein